MEQQFNQLNNSKKDIFAIISFILGIVETTSIINFVINFYLYFRVDTSLIQILSLLISPLVGLIFGIMGLKSNFRNFSIIGIILCSIPFLEVIYLFFLTLVVVSAM